MSPSRLAEDNSEAAPAEAESLFDPSSHRHIAAISGHAIILAVDPHASRAVIDFKDAIPQSAKGIRYTPADSHIFSGKMPRITIDVSNCGPRRTTCKHQHADCECDCNQNPPDSVEHPSPPETLVYVWMLNLDEVSISYAW